MLPSHITPHSTHLHTSQERAAAKALFLTPDKLPTALATTISTTVSTNTSKAAVSTDEPKPASVAPGMAGRLMTEEDKVKVRAAIADAKNAEEVRKLERSLREGWLPSVNPVGA